MLIDEQPYKSDLMRLLAAQSDLCHEAIRRTMTHDTDEGVLAHQVRMFHLLEEFAKKWKLT
jgi:hypothetical protein